MPKQIVATACCRVDLAGGTMDIWPLYLFHPRPVTVNFAVNVMTRCEIVAGGAGVVLASTDTGKRDEFSSVESLLSATRFNHALAGYVCRYFLRLPGKPHGGFTLTTHSESPAGAGISGSSALMIATVAALARFTRQRLGKEDIRIIAQNVEAQLIQVPTGCQDYYPALYGGVNAIHLTVAGIRRERIDVPVAEINSRFVLAYTGAPRQSGINNWEVYKAHIDGDKRVFRNFEAIASIAHSMHLALREQKWPEVARLLRAEWKLRKTNAPGITTPRIEKLIAAAMRNGAWAAKVCGAGGGGCVVFLVDPDARARVQRAIAAAGGEVLPFRVGRSGLTVREFA
jgi:D-glycero-alpha-D-manno-heptose-7-phosphate kinase